MLDLRLDLQPRHDSAEHLRHGVPSDPDADLHLVDLPIPEALARAWGAALVLLVFILLANIGARVLLARTRAKMGP